MKSATSVIFGFLVAVHSAGASTILHTVNPQLYRDEAALYPMVGTVTGTGLNGSGVMISDRWILTAGHIAQNKSAGGTFRVGGVDYTVQNSILHPNFAPASGSYTYALGLLYLSAPVTGSSTAEMLHFDTATSILGREAT